MERCYYWQGLGYIELHRKGTGLKRSLNSAYMYDWEQNKNPGIKSLIHIIRVGFSAYFCSLAVEGQAPAVPLTLGMCQSGYPRSASHGGYFVQVDTGIGVGSGALAELCVGKVNK